MGFHFNVNGLMTCEPYYLSNNNALALAACLSYFPTTMTLMYCYGTIFHAARAKAKYRSVIFNTLPLLAGQAAAGGIDKVTTPAVLPDPDLHFVRYDKLSKFFLMENLRIQGIVDIWKKRQKYVSTNCTKSCFKALLT